MASVRRDSTGPLIILVYALYELHKGMLPTYRHALKFEHRHRDKKITGTHRTSGPYRSPDRQVKRSTPSEKAKRADQMKKWRKKKRPIRPRAMRAMRRKSDDFVACERANVGRVSSCARAACRSQSENGGAGGTWVVAGRAPRSGRRWRAYRDRGGRPRARRQHGRRLTRHWRGECPQRLNRPSDQRRPGTTGTAKS